MTDNNTSTFVENYFKATQSNDAETWAGCFAIDATVDDPVGSPPIQGKDAILERGNEFMANFETVGLYPEYVSVDKIRAAAKWIGRGVIKDRKSVQFEGINFFEFNEAGKITNLVGFWNPADMTQA